MFKYLTWYQITARVITFPIWGPIALLILIVGGAVHCLIVAPIRWILEEVFGF